MTGKYVITCSDNVETPMFEYKSEPAFETFHAAEHSPCTGFHAMWLEVPYQDRAVRLRPKADRFSHDVREIQS